LPLPDFVLAARAGFRLLTLRAGRAAERESLREVAPGLLEVLAPLEWTWRLLLPLRGVQADAADLPERAPEEDGRAACLPDPLEPFPLVELAPARCTGRLLEDD